MTTSGHTPSIMNAKAFGIDRAPIYPVILAGDLVRPSLDADDVLPEIMLVKI